MDINQYIQINLYIINIFYYFLSLIQNLIFHWYIIYDIHTLVMSIIRNKDPNYHIFQHINKIVIQLNDVMIIIRLIIKVGMKFHSLCKLLLIYFRLLFNRTINYNKVNNILYYFRHIFPYNSQLYQSMDYHNIFYRHHLMYNVINRLQGNRL